MKYIDADRLRAEIEKLKDRYGSIYTTNYTEKCYQGGRMIGYEDALNKISSLQQEQPEPTCETCGFYENNCPFIRGKLIPYPNKVCKDYTYSVMKDQPEVDLEKETKRWWKEHLHLNPENKLWMDAHQSVVFARHFYELGLNARKK